jgi:hypothetical protein
MSLFSGHRQDMAHLNVQGITKHKVNSLDRHKDLKDPLIFLDRQIGKILLLNEATLMGLGSCIVKSPHTDIKSKGK